VQVLLLLVNGDRGIRRVAANRADRREGERRSANLRLVLEGLVLVIAAGAVFAVRSRGLLQTRTDGIDPLISAAPVLLAAAATVLLLRLYPPTIRLAARLGRRSRGALGTLGAMQATRALSVLPLAALTTAIALVVSGGLLVDTVRSGQVEGSWQRVGADARVDGPLGDAEIATVAATPGVTVASGVLAIHDAHLDAGAVRSLVTLLAVDRDYDTLLAEQSAKVDGDLSPLFATVGDDDPLPMLVDERISRQLDGGPLTLTIGESRDSIDVVVVGVFNGAASGYETGPFVYLDRAALASRSLLEADANTLLVMGPGAVAATSDLDGERVSRAQWLDDRQHQALVGGVNSVMLLSTGAVALLALIGLLAAALAGSRERRRSLALLRTLGMSSRLGWWLALTELAPLVLTAVIGGVAAGIGIVLVLGPALGLETLAGGVLPPSLSIAPWVIIGVAVAAVALSMAAILTEVVAHRRDRLGDVLRVGESS
jgi:putative ABC transport system permease protein